MSFAGEVLALGGTGDGLVLVDGRPTFVPGALPGERVRGRVVADEGGGPARAVLERVLVPAPERRASPCPHDRPGGCGGCLLLGAGAAAVARWKGDALRARLGREGIDGSVVEPARVAGSGLGYRNRARLLVVAGGRLAYVARPRPEGGRRGRVTIDRCPVLHPLLADLLDELGGRCGGASEIELRAGTATGERMVVVHREELPPRLDPAALDAAVVLWGGAGCTPVRGLPFLHEEVGGVRFRVSPRSFFQVNTEGAAELVALVRASAGAAGAEAWDLFAGVGLFTLAALGEARRRVAVESDPGAVDDLRANAAGAAGVTVRRAGAAEALADLAAHRSRPDVVVADPPRAGLGRETAGRLGELAVPRVVLVSCSPASLVRDLAALRRSHRVERIVPVDLFPGTHHLEAVAVLEAR